MTKQVKIESSVGYPEKEESCWYSLLRQSFIWTSKKDRFRPCKYVEHVLINAGLNSWRYTRFQNGVSSSKSALKILLDEFTMLDNQNASVRCSKQRHESCKVRQVWSIIGSSACTALVLILDLHCCDLGLICTDIPSRCPWFSSVLSPQGFFSLSLPTSLSLSHTKPEWASLLHLYSISACTERSIFLAAAKKVLYFFPWMNIDI